MKYWLLLLLPLNLFSQQWECATTGHAAYITAPRTDDWYFLNAAVHVIHRQNGAFNISDEQIYSGIESLNWALMQEEFKIRIRLSAITRNTWTDLYDSNGVSPNGYTGGEPELTMKQTFGYPAAQYLNIYLVWSICTGSCNFGGAGVQGWATFPNPVVINSSDGIVQLANTFGALSYAPDALPFNLKSYTNHNKTTIHEFGHIVNLYHTFQSTSSCTSETNCLTQGDRVCDTAPHPMTNLCTDNCPDAPNENYMSYATHSCKHEFTPQQVQRGRAAMLTPIRTSQNSYSLPPVSVCEGDVCADAITLNLCEWTGFDNLTCQTDFLLEGMSSFVGNCVNTSMTGPCPATYTHYRNKWFSFNWTGGYLQMIINTNYTWPGVTSGSYGVFHGVMWTLWNKGETCMQSTVVTGSSCYIAAGCNPGIVPHPIGGIGSYDPTRQNWDVYFDLPPGEYYLELMGYGINHTQSSHGSGELLICALSPLSLPPTLTAEGNLLKWQPNESAKVQIARNDWVDVGVGIGEFRVMESGIYRVVDYHGNASNYVHVKVMAVGESIIYGLDGKENAKFGIQITR